MAVAVALFPLLEDDLLLIVQVEAVAFAVADAACKLTNRFRMRNFRLPLQTIVQHYQKSNRFLILFHAWLKNRS